MEKDERDVSSHAGPGATPSKLEGELSARQQAA